MKTIKLILVALSIVSVCMAQTINISGIVKDRAGVGIEGAVVLLEKSGLKNSTKANGSFTLEGVASANKQQLPSQLSNGIFFTQNNRKMNFSLSERAVVKIDIYNLEGSNIAHVQKTFDAGPQNLSLPDIDSRGISLYRVRIGKSEYMFKVALAGNITCCSMESQGTRGVLSKQAKETAIIKDVIKVTKAGFLNYRDSVRNSDTSGIVITLIPSAGSVTDIDGNEYNTVIIGNQEWTVENLRTTKYNDGTTIPHVTDGAAWDALSTPGYCWYNNSTVTAERQKLGALYNWHAVDTKKLAPPGWHVATDAEWTELENYLIGNGYNWDGTTSGNKIAKSLASQTDWRSYRPEGTIGNDPSKNNASGFSALPGGCRRYDGNFYFIGHDGYWWSATETFNHWSLEEYGKVFAWYRYLYFNIDYISRIDYRSKGWGFSVRLLRD